MERNLNIKTDFKINRHGSVLRIYTLPYKKLILMIPAAGPGGCFKIKNRNGVTIYKVRTWAFGYIRFTNRSRGTTYLTGRWNWPRTEMKLWIGSDCRGPPRLNVKYFHEGRFITVSEAQSNKTVASLSQKSGFDIFETLPDMKLHVDAGHNVPLLALLLIHTLNSKCPIPDDVGWYLNYTSLSSTTPTASMCNNKYQNTAECMSKIDTG